jgi:hypothetical protein
MMWSRGRGVSGARPSNVRGDLLTPNRLTPDRRAGPRLARHGADPQRALLIAAALIMLAIGPITHG